MPSGPFPTVSTWIPDNFSQIAPEQNASSSSNDSNLAINSQEHSHRKRPSKRTLDQIKKVLFYYFTCCFLLVNNETSIFKQEEAENLFLTCVILKDIPEEKTFRCDLCDFATVCASSRDQHRQHHGKKAPFSCPLCQYGALSMADLNRHYSNGHRFHQSPNATPLIFSPSLSNMEENIVEDPSAKKPRDSSAPDNDMQWVYLCQHCSFWTLKVELFHVHQVENHLHLHTESNNAKFYYAQRLQDVRILNQIKNENHAEEKDPLEINGTSDIQGDLISKGKKTLNALNRM